MLSLTKDKFSRDVRVGVQPDSEGGSDTLPGPDIQRHVQLPRLLHRSDGRTVKVLNVRLTRSTKTTSKKIKKRVYVGV